MGRLRHLFRAAAALLLLGGAAVLAADAPQARTRVPQPVIESARGGQCVEDPAIMRRDHMKYLKHQRDETVLDYVRWVMVRKGNLDAPAPQTVIPDLAQAVARIVITDTEGAGGL